MHISVTIRRAASSKARLVESIVQKAPGVTAEVRALEQRCSLFKTTNDSLVADMQALSKRNCDLENGMLCDKFNTQAR